jgi:hypothetical protein
VLVGDQPLTDARVVLFELTSSGRIEARGADARGLREAATDADGRVKFDVPGARYQLRAFHGQEFVESPAIVFDPSRRQITTVLLFGQSAIAGVVYDDGVLVSGVPVRVYGIGPAPARHYQRVTDRAGRFEVLELVAGNYGVGIDRAGERLTDDERMLRLGVAERAEVHFGAADPPVQWSGRVVDRSGAPLPGSRCLFFEHDTRRDTRRRWTDAEGRFDVDLAPGVWIVREGDRTLIPNLELPPLGEVQVAREGVSGDVVLPGAVLRLRFVPEGRVDDRGAAPPFFANTVQLFAKHSSGGGERVIEPEELPDKRRQWVRLAPGRYDVRISRPEVSLDGRPPGASVEVTLVEGETVEQTITLAQRP